MLSRTTWRRALAVAITTVVACDIQSRTSLSGNEAARLDVSPKLLTLQQNQAADFTAIAFTSTGDTADLAVSWSATSGTIIDTSTNSGRHNGRYRAGADTGKVKVVAKGRSGGPADTSVVTVTLAPVTTVAVSPAVASVAAGQTVQTDGAARGDPEGREWQSADGPDGDVGDEQPDRGHSERERAGVGCGRRNGHDHGE